MEGLDALKNLEELYLSHNGLTKIEGLENNVGILFLLSHYLTCFPFFSHLSLCSRLSQGYIDKDLS